MKSIITAKFTVKLQIERSRNRWENNIIILRGLPCKVDKAGAGCQ